MKNRSRTTKKLAQRIDRDYFQRVFPLTRWRRILSFGLAAIGVGWLGIYASSRNQVPYSSGPLSTPHATLSGDCGRCHASQQGTFASHVTDQACQACHSVAIHHAAQNFEPACSSCHEEHKGSARLTQVAEGNCTACHADLKVKTGVLSVNAHIHAFGDGHPEFRAVAQGVDATGAKFGHAVHMKADLLGPKGRVTLRCVDCHTINSASARKEMQIGTFAANCALCHPLNFDKRFPDQVPHQETAVVDTFLRDKFRAFYVGHPDEGRSSGSGARLIAALAEVPRTEPGWVEARVAEAEQLLWTKTCKECHVLTAAEAGRLPSVEKTNITARWFGRAEFSHRSHEYLNCGSCHAKASKSTSSSELLLPGIQICQECHRDNGAVRAASAKCSECHVYHDRKLQPTREGKLAIEQVSAVR